MKVTSLLPVLSLLIVGCWTVSETEYPTVAVTPSQGVRVKLTNFRTGDYNYLPVEGHESMSGTEIDPLLIGPDRETQTETSWRMQHAASGRRTSRMVAELKRKGYVIDMRKPQYVIDVKFSEPTWPDNDVLRQLGYCICTLFTAENMIVTWTARLTIRDGVTNKVLYRKDFEQTYDITVWGPIPVGSPACCEKSSHTGVNSWTLTALSDRAIAEATAFITGRH